MCRLAFQAIHYANAASGDLHIDYPVRARERSGIDTSTLSEHHFSLPDPQKKSREFRRRRLNLSAAVAGVLKRDLGAR
jgi:hypothetical protein